MLQFVERGCHCQARQTKGGRRREMGPEDGIGVRWHRMASSGGTHIQGAAGLRRDEALGSLFSSAWKKYTKSKKQNKIWYFHRSLNSVLTIFSWFVKVVWARPVAANTILVSSSVSGRAATVTEMTHGKRTAFPADGLQVSQRGRCPGDVNITTRCSLVVVQATLLPNYFFR